MLHVFSKCIDFKEIQTFQKISNIPNPKKNPDKKPNIPSLLILPIKFPIIAVIRGNVNNKFDVNIQIYNTIKNVNIIINGKIFFVFMLNVFIKNKDK